MSEVPQITSFLALDRDWVEHARCRQPGEHPPDFFPERGDFFTVEAIKVYCRACPVRTRCLDFAVRNHEKNGWWGGLNENARRRFAQLFKIPRRERVS